MRQSDPSQTTGGSRDSRSIEIECAIECPVLIVGGGPSGLLLAYLLSRLKGSIHACSRDHVSQLTSVLVRTFIAEKYPSRLAAPKAHALSPRSLEICRQFGIDTAALRCLGTSREKAQWVNFCDTLSGEEIGRLPYERMDVNVLQATPEMIHNIPQPAFESYIADLLAKDPNSTIQKGLAFSSCEQDDEGVTSILYERATGRRWTIRSRHLVACDGARSTVRSSLGIGSQGEDSYETMMTIHFRADLTSVLGDQVGMLFWMFDPAASGFIIGYDLRGDLVLISNFDASQL